MDRVVGAGVIGYFPVLRPGAPPFVYASQTAVKYPSRAPSAGVPPELLAHPAPSWFVPGGANEDDLTWHVAPARLCGIMRGSFQFWYVFVSERPKGSPPARRSFFCIRDWGFSYLDRVPGDLERAVQTAPDDSLPSFDAQIAPFPLASLPFVFRR